MAQDIIDTLTLRYGLLLPQDYANHAFWSAAGMLIWAALRFLPHRSLWLTMHAAFCAMLGMLLIAGAKKLWDYKYEGESTQMCILKTLITAWVPFFAWLVELAR